ncbi:MAG: cytochrome c [Hyphomicrobiaceae bacterium]
MPTYFVRRSGILAILATPLLALAIPAFADETSDIAAGKKIAETYCAACHAVGTDGDSPREGAPRFRELGQRFPIENLEESLAEGIMTGHPDMPQFEMTPEEIGVFLTYLNSIQVKAP